MLNRFNQFLFLITVYGSAANAQLTQFGLDTKVITSLTNERQDNTGFVISDIIIAGTDDEGIFKTSYIEEQPRWISLGLADKSITALTIQLWGVGPMGGLNLYAGVIPDFQNSDSTLIYRREIYLSYDTLWTPSDSGIDRNNLSSVNAMSAYYFTGHTPPQPLLMGGSFGLYQSEPFGSAWMQSNIGSSIKINSIDVKPHWFESLAWAVGSYGVSPASLRSTDKGTNWEMLSLPFLHGEIKGLAINPRFSDSVYIAYEGKIILTSDGGSNWTEILSSENTSFTTIIVDPLFPENVFAGGVKDTNLFVLYYSSDGGEEWETVSPGYPVYISGISSLIAINNINSQSVQLAKKESKQGYLFIGTYGTGVWRYEYSPVTSVGDKKESLFDFRLSQNYPNPFNPTTNIEFRIAEFGFVSLIVYDVLGREVATLVNEEKPAGIYELQFTNYDLSSGIYYYQLKAGDFIETKKMILLK